MLNRNHNLFIFDVLELLKHLKLESIFVLILDFNALEYSVISELISKANIAVEFVLSNMQLLKAITYWSGAFIATVNGFL